MASTSDFRNGYTFSYNNDIYKIVEFMHVKPGKGNAFVRTKLKSIKSGKVIDKTWRAGEKIDEVRLDAKKCNIFIQMTRHIILWIWLHLNKYPYRQY